MQPLRAALLLLLAAPIVACQAFKLTYNNLDWVAGWQLGRFVDLEAPQKSLFNDRFDEFWGWHRATQLKIYAQDLRGVAGVVHQPLTVAQVDAYMDRAQAHMARAMQEAVPNIAQVLKTLDDEQVQEFLENLAKRRAKSRDESQDMTTEDLVERAEEQLVKNLKRWIGTPNRDQLRRVRDWARERKYAGTIWNQYQEAWGEGFSTVLRHRRDADFVPRLRAFFDGGRVPYDAEMKLVQAHNRKLLVALLADLSAMLTPEQRRHLEGKITELAADLDELAAQSKDTAAR